MKDLTISMPKWYRYIWGKLYWTEFNYCKKIETDKTSTRSIPC